MAKEKDNKIVKSIFSCNFSYTKMAINVVVEIANVAMVNMVADIFGENPKYCALYVGNQNTTLVRTIPVIMEINVNLMI